MRPIGLTKGRLILNPSGSNAARATFWMLRLSVSARGELIVSLGCFAVFRSPGGRSAFPATTQIRWKARWISFQEYNKAMGRPCGQLVGCSVFASSNNSHSIRFGSSGVLILMAEWQAMEAAMRRLSELRS